MSGASKIGIYLHVPFCQSKCEYCGFYSVPADGVDVDGVIDCELRELSQYEIGAAGTVYVGGGSPSYLGVGRLRRLIEGVIEQVGCGQEFTVEVNPGQVDLEMLKMLRGLGVNRLSIGGQSFNDEELKLLGRRHGAVDIYRAVEDARTAGFENINVDLIFAIPGSNVEMWRRSLREVIELGVEHVAAYSLTYEVDTPFERMRAACEIIPTGDETDRVMYEMAIDMLGDAGVGQYEISNFARAGCQCRHNLTYWTNGEYIGIGPAAGSYYGEKRWSNFTDIGRYIAAMEAGKPLSQEVIEISERQKAGETAILMLRLVEGINYEAFNKLTGCAFMELFGDVVKKNQAVGLVEVDEMGVRLTRQGRSVGDSVACDFVI